MIRLLGLIVFLLALAACSRGVLDERKGFDPLLYDPADRQARSVVIAIPGALTSIKVMLPIETWRTRDRTVAYYRLPGFDGRPASDPFTIDAAATRVATFVRDRHFDEIYFVGHSTGAAIALEATKAIHDVRPQAKVHIAGVSTALPAPEPLLAGFRGARDSVAAAWRAGSLRPREIWLEYYRRISYGPQEAQLGRIAEGTYAQVTANEARIQLPEPGLGRKHFSAILGWQNPKPERLAGADMVFWFGSVDPVFPPHAVSRFARGLPNAQLRQVPYHGHVLLLTYPQIWQDIADHWGF